MGIARLKKWAASLKTTLRALYLASRDPRVPTLAKVIIAVVVAYALSPVDLIPDFIPILGYLDDLIFLPIGIWLAVRLIPPGVWQECLKLAEKSVWEVPTSRRAALVIIIVWAFVLVAIVKWVSGYFYAVEN